MKHKNTWRPDTCECVLEYEWDDAEPEAERAHACVRVIVDCGAHGSPAARTKAGRGAHFERVLGENRHKNEVLAEIAAVAPAEHVEEIDAGDGRKVRVLKNPHRWRWGEGRALEIDLDDMPASVRTAAGRRLAAPRFRDRPVHVK